MAESNSGQASTNHLPDQKAISAQFQLRNLHISRLQIFTVIIIHTGTDIFFGVTSQAKNGGTSQQPTA